MSGNPLLCSMSASARKTNIDTLARNGYNKNNETKKNETKGKEEKKENRRGWVTLPAGVTTPLIGKPLYEGVSIRNVPSYIKSQAKNWNEKEQRRKENKEN